MGKVAFIVGTPTEEVDYEKGGVNFQWSEELYAQYLPRRSAGLS